MTTELGGQVISEAASKKRGRPPTYDTQRVALAANFIAPNVKTGRHRQSHYLAAQSLYALRENGEIIDGIDELIGNGRYRVGILAQLGRLISDTGTSDEHIRGLAREASEFIRNGTSVREVERLLVLVRIESREEGGADD